MTIDLLYDIVMCGVVLGVFYSWAIRSIFKDRTHFMSTEFTPGTKRTPHMNRNSKLYPEVIDVYWEDVTEEFSRGVKTHHLVNAMILILVCLYFFSGWIANFIVWLFITIT